MTQMTKSPWRTPCLEITIEEGKTIEEQIQGLVIKVKPEWKKELVKMKKMSGGIVNKMFCCWDESRDNEEDRIVVRIYNRPDEMSDSPAFDPKNEIRILEKISQSGLGPELLVIFNNGICYKYLPGETLNIQTVRSEKFLPHVIELIARLHSLPLTGQDMMWGVKEILEFVPEYPPKLKDPTKLKRLLEVLPDMDTFLREVNSLTDILPTLGSPKVFCHNDSKGENFVWNEKQCILFLDDQHHHHASGCQLLEEDDEWKQRLCDEDDDDGKLTFIDFENASDNNQAFEIGHHFASYNDVMGSTPDTYPDREFQLRWIRLYLEHWFNFTGRKSTDVTDKDVERLYVQANKYAQFSRITIGFGMLGESEGMFQCFEFCLNNLKDYFKYKDEVNALVLPE